MNYEKKISRSSEIGHTALMVLTAMLWGSAFVTQSMGAEHVGTFTFLALRNWLGGAVLVPYIMIMDRRQIRKTGSSTMPQTRRRRKFYLVGGIVCGSLLFLACVLQQAGIPYTTTAKAGFITTLYVVIVPVLSLFRGNKLELKIWICVIFSLTGLYLLCMKSGFTGMSRGDILIFVSAFIYALQIIAVSVFIRFVDGVHLSLLQIITICIIATPVMIFSEKPSLANILAAAVPILYTGIMSSGVAYTLQIIAQKGLNPTVASLAMCLESVFSALFGWLILGQSLNGRELTGCALMFISIVISQIPLTIGKKKQM